MKTILTAVVALAILGGMAFGQDSGGASAADGTPRILTVYFSRTNNTKAIADLVRARVGGDLFQVLTKTPYPADYRETTRVARAEIDSNARPELAATLLPEELRKYDIIFVGYPIWWGTMPPAMFTFLEQHDFSGKTVIPFTTHGGSGLSRSVDDLRRTCPGATILEALAVRGSSAGNAGNDVTAWLRRLRLVD